ncbi:unnamed protein product [Musa hybrid cultivar]
MLPRPSASQCRLQQRAGADGTNNRQIGWMDHSNTHQYEKRQNHHKNHSK